MEVSMICSGMILILTVIDILLIISVCNLKNKIGSLDIQYRDMISRNSSIQHAVDRIETENRVLLKQYENLNKKNCPYH